MGCCACSLSADENEGVNRSERRQCDLGAAFCANPPVLDVDRVRSHLRIALDTRLELGMARTCRLPFPLGLDLERKQYGHGPEDPGRTRNVDSRGASHSAYRITRSDFAVSTLERATMSRPTAGLGQPAWDFSYAEFNLPQGPY